MGSFSSKGKHTSIRVVQVRETTLEVQGTRLSPKVKRPRQDSKVKRGQEEKGQDSIDARDKENVAPKSDAMTSPLVGTKMAMREKTRPLADGQNTKGEYNGVRILCFQGFETI